MQLSEGDGAAQQPDPQEFLEKLSFGKVQGAHIHLKVCRPALLPGTDGQWDLDCLSFLFVSFARTGMRQGGNEWHERWQLSSLLEAPVFPFP